MSSEKPDYRLKRIRPECDQPSPLPENSVGRRELLVRGLQLPAIFALLRSDALAAPATLPHAHSSSVLALAISSDGKLLASGSSEHELKLWPIEAAQFEPFRISTSQSAVSALAFSPDGGMLACGQRAGTIEVYAVPDRRVIKSWTGHSGSDVTSIVFSKDGHVLFSGGTDGTVSVWSLPDFKLAKTFNGNAGPTFSIAVSESGRLLAVAFEKMARLYSIANTNATEPLEIGAKYGHTATIADVTFAPGNLLATASYDNSILVRTTPDLNTLTKFTGHTEPVNAVKWVPPGFIIVSASDDKTIRLWSLRDLKSLQILRGHEALIVSLAVSPDGHTLYSGGGDGAILIWDLAQGKLIGYLFDPLVAPPSFTGSTYSFREATTGRLITYTLPCGSPIPPGATCLCNCVPGRNAPLQPTVSPLPTRPTYVPPIQVPGETIRKPCTTQPVPPGYVCTCNCIPGR